MPNEKLSGPYEPEWTSNQDGYTEEDMRNYAEAAVAAERARWTAAIAAAMPKHELVDDQRAAANTCRAILRDGPHSVDWMTVHEAEMLATLWCAGQPLDDLPQWRTAMQVLARELADTRAALKKANDQAEHFERLWYLTNEDAARYAFAKTLEGQVVTMETFKVRGAAELDQALGDAMAEQTAVAGPVGRQVRPGAAARPLVERLRSGVYGTNRIPLCDEAADKIEQLWHALKIVRQHPEFDDGGPMVEMMDQVLAGKPAPLLEARYDIQRRYGA